MSEQDDTFRRHFVLSGIAETERFRSPQQGGRGARIPNRDRQQHGESLLRQIADLGPIVESAHEAQEAAGFEDGFGIQIEFETFPEVELALESLARERSGIELLNVRHEEQRIKATVFVPHGKLDHFEGLIRGYLEEKRDKRGRPLDHKRLVNAIEWIRAATVRALWTDDDASFPISDDEAIWWEVWLPVRGDRHATTQRFRDVARGLSFEIAPGELQFPERTILLMFGSSEQMKRSMLTLNSIAELRRAKETADFFDALTVDEHAEWIAELLGRTNFSAIGQDQVHVCLLDTGTNYAHPVIAQALDVVDMHTVEPAWGVDDHDGHGTAMAGLALMGNLVDALASAESVSIGHRLESVKLLPGDGGNKGDARHHGYLTTEAVARPEVGNPLRNRVFGMAITARDNRDRGRPSAWSAAIDRLAVDAIGEQAKPRLLVISGGNVEDPNAWSEYPSSNTSDGIHDPGQAWNALTVGASTGLIDITEADADGYQPVAPAGGLSPFSTTSATWQPQWPLKPDVVFEGGNAARDFRGAVVMHSLSLLTTHHLPNERLLTTMNATSAATALGTQMAAQLMDAYPELWPESIRALIVHSAEWTPAMCQAFLPATPNKGDYAHLVRHCGFGIPNLERALWSVSNSLTLIGQERLYPFRREKGKEPALRDMNLHRLPWPLEELEALGDAPVEMRVTLSYFIEPNPAERGHVVRYRYESHGLRFDVKRASETDDDFRRRVNAAARAEEERSQTAGDDSAWLIGKQARHRGSLHSDLWRGTAADLASRGVLAVYPALGWWKTRPRLESYDKAARYSLLVSIHAPTVEIDLYSAVANQIVAPVQIET